jgi:excisionase family DNA binding protein
MNVDQRVVSVSEAARILGISRSHAYDLVRRREWPAIRLGRRIIVPLRAIEDILASTPV